MPVTTSEFIKNKTRINDLLEKLRNKLRNFTVINMSGQIIGKVEDFSLDKNRHLKMVISQSDPQGDFHMLLLSSQYIQKVDTLNRELFVDVSKAELARSPVYPPDDDKAIQLPAPSAMPPATQSSIASFRERPDMGGIHPPEDRSFATQKPEDRRNESTTDSDDTPEVVEEEMVRLLEERLVVNRSKRKVGEVVVRKEIETRIVEVPVQREKLIIEQVGPETKKLAEIDLGEGEVTGVDLAEVLSSATVRREVPSSDSPYTVSGEFLSPKAAAHLLEAIALQGRHGCAKVRVELVVDNPELQEKYQKMFDRCSIG